ncbi:MAG: hypothetical protein JOZ78_00065 [Chroococcidiopsidaceae cyanobacterium CP_BM_ER_R8_30]|nr:hypothetical protein [Chroococcidiopsidaceae cyanobacterium CP_BM_ER_R8_30]
MSSQQNTQNDAEQVQVEESRPTIAEGSLSELADSQLEEVVGGTAQNRQLELQQRHAEEGGN